MNARIRLIGAILIDLATTLGSDANISSTGLDSRPQLRNLADLLAQDANRPTLSIASTSST